MYNWEKHFRIIVVKREGVECLLMPGTELIVLYYFFSHAQWIGNWNYFIPTFKKWRNSSKNNKQSVKLTQQKCKVTQLWAEIPGPESTSSPIQKQRAWASHSWSAVGLWVRGTRAVNALLKTFYTKLRVCLGFFSLASAVCPWKHFQITLPERNVKFNSRWLKAYDFINFYIYLDMLLWFSFKKNCSRTKICRELS